MAVRSCVTPTQILVRQSIMARCHPDLPLPTANYDAIVVMGGGQTDGGPPPHVAARLELALRMYSKAAPKPKIIVSGQ